KWRLVEHWEDYEHSSAGYNYARLLSNGKSWLFLHPIRSHSLKLDEKLTIKNYTMLQENIILAS
ncbi:MAG: hypothetical protein WKF91_14600, partial [Segetibacter sp.]